MEQKDVHEGTITFIVCCQDDTDKEYMNNVYLDQEQVDKFNLKERDRVLYKLTKDGYAEIVGKVHIEKTIEELPPRKK